MDEPVVRADLSTVRGSGEKFSSTNLHILNWQLSNCGFFLENQRQFFHGTT